MKDSNIQEYLRKQIASRNLKAETANRAGNRELYIRDNVIELRKQITIGGKVALLESGDDKLVGLNGFDGDKLSSYVNQVITAIKFGYDKQANAGTAKVEDLKYNTTVPGVIRSARLNVMQDGVPVISLPVASLISTGNNTKVGDDFRELKSYALLKEDLPISIELEFPKGATIAGTDKHYVEVLFNGSVTVKK